MLFYLRLPDLPAVIAVTVAGSETFRECRTEDFLTPLLPDRYPHHRSLNDHLSATLMPPELPDSAWIHDRFLWTGTQG